MTKGKELGASSALFPILLLMCSAHGLTERSSSRPPGTACPGIQSWRETCVHQITKLSSPALCSLPQPRQKKACGLSGIKQPPHLTSLWDKARCGAAPPKLPDCKDGDLFP